MEGLKITEKQYDRWIRNVTKNKSGTSWVYVGHQKHKLYKDDEEKLYYSNEVGTRTYLEVKEGLSLDDLLKCIAEKCIANNWYRTDDASGGYHYFTQDELKEYNELQPREPIDGGYCFLDEDGIPEGMIRSYSGNCNPKWSFWIENGELKIDFC